MKCGSDVTSVKKKKNENVICHCCTSTDNFDIATILVYFY